MGCRVGVSACEDAADRNRHQRTQSCGSWCLPCPTVPRTPAATASSSRFAFVPAGVAILGRARGIFCRIHSRRVRWPLDRQISSPCGSHASCDQTLGKPRARPADLPPDFSFPPPSPSAVGRALAGVWIKDFYFFCPWTLHSEIRPPSGCGGEHSAGETTRD